VKTTATSGPTPTPNTLARVAISGKPPKKFGKEAYDLKYLESKLQIR